MTDDQTNKQTNPGEDSGDSKDAKNPNKSTESKESPVKTPAAEPQTEKEAETKPTEDTDTSTDKAEATKETETKQEAEAEPDVLEKTEQEAEPEVEEIPFQDIKSGMTVRVHEKIIDTNPKGEERERIQVFQGMILGVRGSQNQRTITVRKVNKGLGVEKIFPLSSPNVTKIEVLKKARVRRAKLGFLRDRYKKRLKETKMEEVK